MKCTHHRLQETCSACKLLSEIEEGLWDDALEDILEAGHRRKRDKRIARTRGGSR